jgi:L-alanine-DL-glutamate epimerase-like enolase superfamily enzyme
VFSLSRRRFLGAFTAGSFAAFDALAAPERGRARISDIRVMVLPGPRTYTLVKVLTDAGVYGIGEGYGSPGVGIKEGVLELRPYFIGKDPLEIEALYNGLGNRTDGSAHMLLRAASAIEIALWDLAGKLLNQPAAVLPGGRYGDRVRVYHEEGPRNMLDRSLCNEWADEMKSDPAGWTAFKISPPRSAPRVDNARDPANRLLTSRELREIRQGFEYCRDAIGWDCDLIVHCGCRIPCPRIFRKAACAWPPIPGAHRYRRKPGAPAGFQGFHIESGMRYRAARYKKCRRFDKV